MSPAEDELDGSSMPYRVLCRAAAAFIFKDGEALEINYARGHRRGRIRISTRYYQDRFSVPVPGDLSLDMEVEAESLKEAATWGTVGREIAGLLVVCCNAMVAPVKPEIVYDMAPGSNEHEYFQRYERADDVCMSSRFVPMDAVASVMAAVVACEDRDRVFRAVAQYAVALELWEFGNELLVLSHLWMGIEALKTAALRRHLSRLQISEEQLGEQWGWRDDGRRRLRDFLEAQARLQLVCAGDAARHRKAKEISDAFEHGFQNGGELFEGARRLIVPVARYLRTAILDVLDLPEEVRARLLKHPYHRPRGRASLEQYLHAKLIGEAGSLSPEGQHSPRFEWKHELEAADFDEAAKVFNYRPKNVVTAILGEGVTATNFRYEVWDGGGFFPDDQDQEH